MATSIQPDLFDGRFEGVFSADTPTSRPAPRSATARQLSLAQRIATEGNLRLPADILLDARALSTWIERHKPRRVAPPPRFSNYPSSKQVAFAERIARLKRRDVPRECFRDRRLMSRWIDGNK